jgi:hypothetical protein
MVPMPAVLSPSQSSILSSTQDSIPRSLLMCATWARDYYLAPPNGRTTTMAHAITSLTYSSVLSGDEDEVDMINYTRVGTGTCPKTTARSVDRCQLPRATQHEYDITRYKPVDTTSPLELFPDTVQPFSDPGRAPVSGV